MRTLFNAIQARWHRRSIPARVAALVLMTFTSSGITPSNAMPPHPDLLARIQRGEMVAPRALTDRALLLAAGVDRPAAPLSATATAGDSFRTLAILVRYSDATAQADPAEFDALLYGNGTSSVRDFYGEVSYGKMDMITVDLPSSTGWQAAPQTQAYYADSGYGLYGTYPQNAQRLVEDAVAAADAIVDFSVYDNDGDGWLDALMIIHTGPGAEFTGNPNDIWSHKWGISSQLRDGVRISNYAMMPEYWSVPGDMTIGVFAHELGHVFGLPDLYDRDYSSYGVGKWSLMAGGSWNGTLGSSPAHPDAWCRIQLGFTTPIVLSSQSLGTPIPQIETDTVIYQLWDAGTIGSEYFLVENRQRTGFDAALPSAGLMIWHVDETVGSTQNDKEWYPGFTSSGNYLVAAEPADGLWNLEKKQNSGDSGDPFPGSTGNRAFTSGTTPNSLAYDGSVSLVSVTNISNSQATMTADMSVTLALGVDDDVLPTSVGTVSNYPNPFNAGTTIRGTAVSPGRVRVSIYNVLGERVRVLESPGVVTGEWEVMWDGKSSSGAVLSSGVYWYQVAGKGVNVTGRMVMLK